MDKKPTSTCASHLRADEGPLSELGLGNLNDIFLSDDYFSFATENRDQESDLHDSLYLNMEALSLNLDFLESDFLLDNEDDSLVSSETQNRPQTDPSKKDDLDISEEDADYDTWVYQALALEEFLEQLTTHQFSTHAVFEALFLSGGDLQLAADAVLAAQDRVEQCRPCRHMLTGKCYRSDCVYDHDLSPFPCRFWMSPVGCSKFSEGQPCPFLHQLPSPYDHSYMYSAYLGNNGELNNGSSSSGSGSGSSEKVTPVFSDADFPVLSTGKTTQPRKTGAASANNTSKQSTLSEAEKIKQSMFSGPKTSVSAGEALVAGIPLTSQSGARSSRDVTASVKLTKEETLKWRWKDTGKSLSRRQSA